MSNKRRLVSTTAITLAAMFTPLQTTAPRAVVLGGAHHDSKPARDARLARPHLLDNAVGDVVVRLQGERCSGTPITGTVYVVTAAHCVLTDSGEVTRRTIVREHIRYPAVAVLVDTGYHDHPTEELDVAVLIMAEDIPGPSARVGSALPASGHVTLAGFQFVDSHGKLLRGRRPNNLLFPPGTPIDNRLRPAGCVEPVATLEVSAARVMVPCGLVPGASGGGLFTEVNGELALVGIVSTVTVDLSTNGLVPLASLQELLEHPDRYTHVFSAHPRRDRSRSPDVVDSINAGTTTRRHGITEDARTRAQARLRRPADARSTRDQQLGGRSLRRSRRAVARCRRAVPSVLQRQGRCATSASHRSTTGGSSGRTSCAR